MTQANTSAKHRLIDKAFWNQTPKRFSLFKFFR